MGAKVTSLIIMPTPSLIHQTQYGFRVICLLSALPSARASVNFTSREDQWSLMGLKGKSPAFFADTFIRPVSRC